MPSPSAVKPHDYWNILALAVLICIDVYYLSMSTSMEDIGTPRLGASHLGVFNVFYALFMLYLVVDTIWIIVIPNCTVTDRMPIIVHHVLTGVYAMIPAADSQFSWHMAVVLLVEINTLFLTWKRNVSKDSLLHFLLNLAFYLTWVGMRLIGFPILVVFLYYEWQRYTILKGTPFNCVLLAPIFQALVTALSFKWTYDMARKMLKGKAEKRSE